MAGVTAHVECGVAAAFRGDILTLVVARETEVALLIAGRRFKQLILVVARMWIVTGQAVTNRGLVNRTFELGRVFVAVAGQAKLVGGSGDQHHPGDVFVNPDFVTAQAPRGDGGVDRLTFAFVFVALQALRRIYILLERDRVGFGGDTSSKHYYHEETDQRVKPVPGPHASM